MHRKISSKYLLIILLLVFSAQKPYAQKILENQLSDSLTAIARKYATVGRITVSSIKAQIQSKTLTVTISDRLAEIPLRPENVSRIYQAIERTTKGKYPGYKLICISDKKAIEDLIPNFYRTETEDVNRKP